MMRNIVKVWVLILFMSVIMRDTEGAKIYAVKGPDVVATDRPIAGEDNVTDASGLVKSTFKTFKDLIKNPRPELAL